MSAPYFVNNRSGKYSSSVYLTFRYVYIHIYTHVYVCTQVCMHACVCVVCMHAHTHTHTHTQFNQYKKTIASYNNTNTPDLL